MSFHGATVLITGGSRGLGLLLARELGAQGARVAICARDADELDRAAADLEARGIAVLALRGDAWFSISDALPLVSMDAERAARQIVAACARGEPEVTLSGPAKLAARVHGLAPGLVSEVLGVVNRLLPAPGGIGRGTAKGHESESALSPSWLTRLGDAAAVRHNEVPNARRPA